MGNLRLLQERPEEALDLLEKALKITRINEREKNDQGDSARVLDKLAKTYEMLAHPMKSKEARTEADTIYATLTTSGLYDPIGSEDEKWEFLTCIKFR
ncbi:hypothetical protein IFR05_006866 [Cadophora sp. M221]|nr:hypothetical protein IFR05_006866 [Cadophora sp. M221]